MFKSTEGLMLKRFLLLVLSCGICSVTLAQGSSAAVACEKGVPVIQTQMGKVCGLKQQNNGEKAYAYLGIPYAKPPVGKRRWQSPQSTTPWQRTFKATQIMSECPQPSAASMSGFTGSENCLYLNVWKPTQSSSTPRAVMVFIPGGGFLTGQGGYLAYDGTYLAGFGNVIVVTLNYRLGALGFLRYQKNHSNISGNFALLDQLAALKWVHQNIIHFGGDPKKVTIFGESAGAMSVGTHLFAMPASQHFFRAAVMESNVLSIPYKTRHQAEQEQEKFISLLCQFSQLKGSQCPRNAAWLRHLPLKIVMRAENALIPAGGVSGLLLEGMVKGLLWQPTVGVYPVVGQPNQGFQPGTAPKPFVIGTNRNEGVFFMPEANKFNAQDYEKILISDFGAANAKRILNYSVDGAMPYNPANYHYDKASQMTPAAQAMARAMTDYGFTGASIATVSKVRRQMKTANLPIYGYRFTQRSSFNYAIFERCGPVANNICHTEEIPYVFHNFVERVNNSQAVLSENKVTPAERKLSREMVQAWVGFAKDPVNYKKGFGYPPLQYAVLGPYVEWSSPVTLINNLGALINYHFWHSIRVALQHKTTRK